MEEVAVMMAVMMEVMMELVLISFENNGKKKFKIYQESL